MSYIIVTKYIENAGQEIEIEVGFDFNPPEPMTRDYPGCNADVDICEIKVAETGAEIDYISSDDLDALREELLNDYFDNMREAKSCGRYIDVIG